MIEELAEHVESAHYDVEDDLAIRLIDAATAFLSGINTEEYAHIRMLVGKMMPATRKGLEDVFLGVSATRMSEIDDIHRKSCTTPGSIVWPTVFGCLNKFGNVSLQTVIDSVYVGYDVITWFGEAVRGPYLLSRGIWPTLFAASLGTAAVASRMMGLSKKKTANAISLALSASYGISIPPPKKLNARWVLIGNAAWTGFLATMSAKEGFSAELNLVEKRILENMYHVKLPSGRVRFVSRHPSLRRTSVKEYCSAKQIIAAIEALNKIITAEVNAKDIESVKLFVPTYYSHMVSIPPSPLDRLSSITSAAYQLAVTCLKPEVLFDVRRKPLYMSDKVRKLMGKVIVAPNPSLNRYYPESWPALVKVESSNGEYHELVTETKGDLTEKYTIEDALTKLRRFVTHYLGSARTAKIESRLVRALDSKRSFRQLAYWLTNTLFSGF
ncbi:MAG: MmgE/PrpD family protein [Candidatus Caldarchaeum sp.]